MIDKEYLFQTIDNFKNCKILVVGDIILDEYIWGKATRLSPEAPVPVLEVSKYSYILGGAANVASNIAVLGGSVTLAGVVGDDDQADRILNLLENLSINQNAIIKDAERPTTLKTRMIAHNHQQLARADREIKTPISSKIQLELLNSIKSEINKIDLIVLSDYAKGVLTESLISEVIKIAKLNKIDVLVDPKGLDFSKYKGATLITPNRLEAECATKSSVGTSPEIMAKQLKQEIDVEHILITLGEDGVLSYSDDKINIIPAVTSEVYDVTGAGDSMISTLALAFPATGKNLYSSILLGNYAAGVVVRKAGTTTVSNEQLKEIIETDLRKTEKQKIGC